MRKTAFLSTLAALLVGAHLATAQDIYIRYDANCMDKLEYRFVEQPNGVSYNSYRLNKNANEKLYFETGIESPQIRKSAPAMLTCGSSGLGRNEVADINSGRRRAFICKKLDSGWAILPVGTASYMSFADNALSAKGSDYDFRADFKTTFGNDLSVSERDETAKSAIYYVTEVGACNQVAYQFKKEPLQTCRDAFYLTYLPSVGLLRDETVGTTRQTFELVSINGVDACSYLAQARRPAAVQTEAVPDVPKSYSFVPQTQFQGQMLDEVTISEPISSVPAEAPALFQQPEFVATKTVVEESNITRSE